MRCVLAGLVVLAALRAPAAAAHDVSVDLSSSLTTSSSANPRAGSVGVGVSGSFDLNDAWSLLGTFVYTRDFATRTEETSSPGSNVFMLSGGAMWLISDHFMTMLLVNGSPTSNQPSATSFTFVDPTTRMVRTADVLVNSRTWSVGGTWTGGWASNGEGAWESAVDLTASVNRFDVFQRVGVPDTPRGVLLRQACATREAVPLCQLVNGASTPLVQAKLAAGYTGTLFEKTDFGLEGAFFLYDQDPTDVGYFSIVAAGRGGGLDLGNGVPVLPLLASVRPSVVHRFSKVTLKGAYQLGVYSGGLGLNHVATLRVTWKVTRAWRLMLTVTAQVDSGSSGLSNLGGTALLGTMFVF